MKRKIILCAAILGALAIASSAQAGYTAGNASTEDPSGSSIGNALGANNGGGYVGSDRNGAGMPDATDTSATANDPAAGRGNAPSGSGANGQGTDTSGPPVSRTAP